MDGNRVARQGFKLLAGTANPALAEEIARCLGVELCKVTIGRFTDGEIFVRIDENIRGSDIFIVQPTNPASRQHPRAAASHRCRPPGLGGTHHLRHALLRVFATGSKGPASRGHRRQARRQPDRGAGADRVLGIDFHQHQLQGFFDVPVDHFYAAPVFVSHYRKKQLKDPRRRRARRRRRRRWPVASPNASMATLAIIDKRRPRANVAEVVNVVGEVAGRDCTPRQRHDRHGWHRHRSRPRAEATRRQPSLRLRHPCRVRPGARTIRVRPDR